MKKLIFIITICVCAMPCWAAEKCVYVPSFCFQNISDNGGYYRSNWDVACEYQGEPGYMFVRGVSGCFADEYNTGVSGSNDDNIWCWCKMTYPVVSDWVLSSAGDNLATSCQTYCNAYCGDAVRDNENGFITQLFDSVQQLQSKYQSQHL